MLTANIVNAESFLIFELIDESGNKVDSAVINKYTPESVLYFYDSADDYIEEYEDKLRKFADEYEERIDFDDVTEKRSYAEFLLYSAIKELNG